MREALRRRPPGRFALMAAIAAVHDEAPTYADTDWREIVGLYDCSSRCGPPRWWRSTGPSPSGSPMAPPLDSARWKQNTVERDFFTPRLRLLGQ